MKVSYFCLWVTNFAELSFRTIFWKSSNWPKIKLMSEAFLFFFFYLKETCSKVNYWTEIRHCCIINYPKSKGLKRRTFLAFNSTDQLATLSWLCALSSFCNSQINQLSLAYLEWPPSHILWLAGSWMECRLDGVTILIIASQGSVGEVHKASWDLAS